MIDTYGNIFLEPLYKKITYFS
ncbi:hypothetical protein [Clostridium culturomicium]